MVYIPPDKSNINFILRSDYTPPSIENIPFAISYEQGTTDPINYYFEGTVGEGMVALSGVAVHLYKHSTGELVSSTFTSSSGSFALPWAENDEYYYIVALFPDSTYNALIYDYLYPTVSGS